MPRPRSWPAAFDQAETQGKKIFRRQAFFFSQSFENRIGGAAVETGQELDGWMLAIGRQCMRMQFQLRQCQGVAMFGFELARNL